MQRHGVSRRIVESLYLPVGTNNIGFVDEEGKLAGYGLYRYLSRANHGCGPNTQIVCGDPGSGETVLKARCNIYPGESITWSYLDRVEGVPFDQADFFARNWALVKMLGFACACTLCRQQMPDRLKSTDLIAFFTGKQERSTVTVILYLGT